MEKTSIKSKTLTKDEIVEKYQYLVVSIAAQINSRLIKTLSLEDLIQSGMVGLLESVDRFDPHRGVDFATFAYYRIKGAIYDSLRAMGYLPPSEKRARIDANLNETSLSNESNGNSEVSVDAEIEQLETAVSTLLASYFLTVSLDETNELKVDSTQSESVEMQQVKEFLNKSIKELPKSERQLIEGIYFKQISSSQVCKNLNISKSWGSKLHASGVERLRKKLIQAGIFST